MQRRWLASKGREKEEEVVVEQEQEQEQEVEEEEEEEKEGVCSTRLPNRKCIGKEVLLLEARELVRTA